MALSYAFMPEIGSVVSVIDGIVSPMPERTARVMADDFRATAKRFPNIDAYFTARADEIDAALAFLTPAAEAAHQKAAA